MWNSDQLPEQVYQPHGTQDDCVTVHDNYSQVMIEIHHGGKPVSYTHLTLPTSDLV